jgi:hypothetical protein
MSRGEDLQRQRRVDERLVTKSQAERPLHVSADAVIAAQISRFAELSRPRSGVLAAVAAALSEPAATELDNQL